MPSQATVAGLRVSPEAALTALATLMRAVAVRGDSIDSRPVTHLAADPVADGISLTKIESPSSTAGLYSAAAADPALFGTLATLAADILAAPSLPAAAEAMSWMLADADRRISPKGVQSRRRRLEAAATGSPVLDAIVLRHRATSMDVADRLAHRTGNTVPRRPPASAARAGEWPFSPGRMTSVPPRLVPQTVWRPVAAAVPPPGTRDTGAFAAVLSMAVVHSGICARWDHIAIWLMLPPRFGRTSTAIFKRLEHAGHLEETLTSIEALVELLTEHPPPIDYARRRWLFHDLDFVAPLSRLRRACHADGLKLTERRIRYATMLLWENLTGGDVRFASRRLTPRNYVDRAEYMEFRSNCGDAIREYMAVEGERLLLRNSIDEPVTWQPEPTGPAGQAWRSPPADLTRRLPGWEGQRRRGKLRRGARDHTPRVADARLPAPFLAASPTSADAQALFDNQVTVLSFLIDLTNWPSSGQIDEKLAK